MQRCINVLKMADVHGKITLKPLIPLLGWKRLKSLNLDYKKRECSSKSDVGKVLLTNRSYHLATGSVSNHLHSAFIIKVFTIVMKITVACV